MLLSRNPPKNIVLKDNYLFSHEYLITARQTHSKRLFFRLLNLYNLTTFGDLIQFEAQHLKLDKAVISRLFIFRFNFKLKGILILDKWSNNYFHWCTEVLPRLYYVSQKQFKYPIFIPLWLLRNKFVRDTLMIFPDLKFKIIEKGSYSFILKLVTIDLGVSKGNYQPLILKDTVISIISKLCIKAFSAEKRIFVFRSIKEKRGIINFHELSDILFKYKIQIYDLNTISWHEQIMLMQECNFLIGVHGAGLTNLMFMKKDAHLLELRKRFDDTNNCYFSLASVFEINYWYLECDVDNADKVTQLNNFILERNTFDSLLATILSKSTC